MAYIRNNNIYTNNNIGNVKEIKWKIFIRSLGKWVCKDNEENRKIIVKIEPIEEYEKQQKEISSIPFSNNKFCRMLEVPTLQLNLKRYQKSFVWKAEKLNGRILNADEMGLGKTIETLAYIEHKQIKKTLIVCPASLKYKWKYEAKRTLSKNKKIHIINGRKEYDFPQNKNIYICNYDILINHIEEINKNNFALLIMDECHYIRNKNTQRTKAIYAIYRKINHIIALTGTPILRKPYEIYNTLHILYPKLFPNFYEYAKRYCNLKKTYFGIDFKGASNQEELYKKISPIMIRRLKKDVEKELPDKTRILIPIHLKRKKEYNLMEEKFKSSVKRFVKERTSQNENIMLGMFAKIKSFCIEEKMTMFFEWLDNFLETEQKIVIMGYHKKTINTIECFLKKKKIRFVKVVGGISAKEKFNAENEFQTKKETQVFIGNWKAAGEGLTLTAASNMVLLEFPRSPALIGQIEDRIHRITQKDKCFYYYFILTNTVEENDLKYIDEYQDTINKAIENKTSKYKFYEEFNRIKGKRL